jgi:hypothetical protein
MSTLSLAVPTGPAGPADELAEDVETFARCNATLGMATRLWPAGWPRDQPGDASPEALHRAADRAVHHAGRRRSASRAGAADHLRQVCVVSSIRFLSPFDAHRLPHGRSYQSGGGFRLARACTPWAEFADRTNRSTEPRGNRRAQVSLEQLGAENTPTHGLAGEANACADQEPDRTRRTRMSRGETRSSSV